MLATVVANSFAASLTEAKESFDGLLADGDAPDLADLFAGVAAGGR